ncbi:sigma-70 family RNA polymerase sigma factor [Thermoactinospora rubra]|uniref:sigma-70 family RNA polymerase sigma factor n=1 Tax=Thermoactinospora rubra TaxID=1088767 RepID=UPI000A1130BD|nr:sigma-70 family RNA polymerase sigma factor [Thermoactinospora rubra]
MDELERHRAELTGYCYRMLGSPFEAEDAVQETLVKAWRHLAAFDESRASIRTWLFRIATNVCLDMLRGARRRARPVDLAPAARPGPDIGAPLPETAWVLPIPDALLDPAELAVSRESVRLAFVAALQHLPPRQRAVLILREVLKWSAAETAALLGASVAAVNSALQRARAALPATGPAEPVDEALVARYVDAFQRHDVDRLVALLHEDATTSMPPFTWWLRGREHIRAVLLHSDAPCRDARLVPARANGSPVFGQFHPDGRPFALLMVETRSGLVSGTTTFLDAERIFPLFDEFRAAGPYTLHGHH